MGERTDKPGGFRFDVTLAPLRIALVEQFVDESVKDVWDRVDNHSAISAAITTNWLYFRISLAKRTFFNL